MLKNTTVKSKSTRKNRTPELPPVGQRNKGFRPEGVSTVKHATGSMREHAIAVLEKSKHPLKCADLFKAIVARGWTTLYGATPVATLSTKLLSLQRQGVVQKNDNAEYAIVPENKREKFAADYAKSHPQTPATPPATEVVKGKKNASAKKPAKRK